MVDPNRIANLISEDPDALNDRRVSGSMYQLFQQQPDGQLNPVTLVDQKVAFTGLRHTMPFVVLSRADAEEAVALMNKRVKEMGFGYTYRKINFVAD